MNEQWHVYEKNKLNVLTPKWATTSIIMTDDKIIISFFSALSQLRKRTQPNNKRKHVLNFDII